MFQSTVLLNRHGNNNNKVNDHPLMSFFKISNNSGFEILPSPFLSMVLTNWLTSSFLAYLLRPRLLKASFIRQVI